VVDEAKKSAQDQILKGAVARLVYSKAVQALPKGGASFHFEFLDTLTEFEGKP